MLAKFIGSNHRHDDRYLEIGEIVEIDEVVYQSFKDKFELVQQQSEPLNKPNKVEVEVEEEEDIEPDWETIVKDYHTGGPYYTVNGETIKGKDNAIVALKMMG